MLLESFQRHHRNELYLFLFIAISALAFTFPVLSRGTKKEKALDQLGPVETRDGRFIVSIPNAPGTFFEALPVQEPDYEFNAAPEPSDTPENIGSSSTQPPQPPSPSN